MVQSSQSFPHIQLKFTTEGSAVPPSRGGGEKNPITVANLGNRQGHGSKLKNSVDSLIFEWQETQEERDKEGKPQLPENAQPIILQIDPIAFDSEDLRKYGIEVIAELENGYIIGASANDPEFSELQKKIEKFIKAERGVNKVSEIWEILDGTRRPEYILSPELLNEWENITDDNLFIVDVGIACIGSKSQFSDYPEQKPDETYEKYTKRVSTWINKRDLTYQEWDVIKSKREDDFTDFVQEYQGEIFDIIDGNIPDSAQLPDSFSCKIQISGKGLKDLVLNFPYIFDVSLPDDIAEFVGTEVLSDIDNIDFQLEPPESNAPKVCVIDSGIQERHSLLKVAIDFQNSTSWIPGETDKTADFKKENGGHGTSVAGAILYPRNIPRTGRQKAICWIQNARVLQADGKLPEQLFPPILLSEIIEFYHKTGTRIFNHSITGSVPFRTRYMSAWAASIDYLTWQRNIWQEDILVIVAAGNIPLDNRIGITRLSIKDHLLANRVYPDYLLEDSCRIANPAQSFQALTVGSISSNYYHTPPYSSIAQKDQPSAFSCSGLGIWNTIKPEVVEYGGDLVKDEGTPPNIILHKDVAPELVRSTLYAGPAVGCDKVGTSFAAPKVSHIAARLAAELPNESCLLYRALIVQSARWPEWAMVKDVNKLHVIRQIGYGLPNVDRALGNSPNRVTLMTTGDRKIVARQAHIYQVKLPEKLRSPGDNFQIFVEVTLSYKAQPRRTRRNHRKYLSTWLDWECSKKGEDPGIFLARILKEYDTPEDSDKKEKGFKWTLGKKSKNHGKIDGVSRSAGTIQKDWTIVNSFELTDAFCIAVVGYEGWNNDPFAEVPYSLVVSFEAIQADIPIYTSIVEAQIETEVQTETEIEIQSL
jgi:hypothetical protein